MNLLLKILEFKIWLKNNLFNIFFYPIGILLLYLLLKPYIFEDEYYNSYYEPETNGFVVFLTVIYSMILLIKFMMYISDDKHYGDYNQSNKNYSNRSVETPKESIFISKEARQKKRNGGLTDKELKTKKENIRKKIYTT
jgi:hypothetical protein